MRISYLHCMVTFTARNVHICSRNLFKQLYINESRLPDIDLPGAHLDVLQGLLLPLVPRVPRDGGRHAELSLQGLLSRLQLGTLQAVRVLRPAQHSHLPHRE